MKTIFIITALTMIMGIDVYCQEIIPAEMIEKAVESLDSDRDSESLYEEMADRVMRPVNLNAATREEIGAIPFLSPAQQKNLLDYIATYGEVFSLYELQSISGFDSALIRKIEPFIVIKPKSEIPPLTPGNLIRFGHHDLLVRYEQTFPTGVGYLANDSIQSAKPGYFYPGEPQKYYFRYTFNWFDKVRIGFAGEKDPGEQFFRGAQSKGMDFYAGFISFNNFGILENLTIGNFRAGFGQGLTFGSGLSMNAVPGFSSNPLSTSGVRPSMGMNEGSYLRGAAATIKINHFRISSFISYHPRDATVTEMDTTSGTAEEISSLIETGYHRTGLELEKRNVMTELIFGGNINLTLAPSQKFGFRIGATGVYVKYSAGIAASNDLYKMFSFSGNQNMNVGIDYQARYGKLFLFGEISRSMNGGIAWLGGATLTPDPRATITMVVRNYQPQYQNLYSNAFGQQSLNTNEQGAYISLNAAVHPKISLSGFVDIFKIPWLKYRVDGPSLGRETGLMLTWLTSRNVTSSIRYLQKTVSANKAAESGQIVHELMDYTTRSYRFSIDWTPIPRLLFKTRLDIKEAGETQGKTAFGYLMYQDFQVTTTSWFSAALIRFAVFDAPDYATRIYVYEPEVLYGYSVPAYQGQGIRSCVVLKFNPVRCITLWIKSGITWYSDRNEVGSGLDMTKGNMRGEATLQIMARL